MGECKYSSYLSSYLDQQLKVNQENMLEKHLPLCTNCQRELKELKQIKQIFSNLSIEEVPVRLHQQTVLQIRSKRKLTDKTYWIKRIVLPMAVMVVLLLIGKVIAPINGNIGRDMHYVLDNENLIMATPEVDGISRTISKESDFDASAADEFFFDKATEDRIGNRAEAGSSSEKFASNNQAFDLPKPVKIGTGVALLLAFIYLSIKSLKLKR